MEAKSRANFINSVVGGKKIPCPKCNTLNEAGSRFCITCGTPLAQEVGAAVCPKCGTANENGSKFCISCGALLDQDEKTAVKDAAGGVSAEVPFAQVKMEDQQVKKPATANEEKPAAVPFAPARKRPVAPAAEAMKPASVPVPRVQEMEEEKSAFAEGLPAWDIVPPQVMVRRKRR